MVDQNGRCWVRDSLHSHCVIDKVRALSWNLYVFSDLPYSSSENIRYTIHVGVVLF